MRGNGERIGPQNLPTSSIAGGIWNLLNQQRAQQRGAWPSATPAVVTDPYFMYVPLLLNTTSTNAQQNNTFLDSSTNNFTITRNGTPTQGAFTPYQPSGYWSGYFGGTSDYLTIANNAAFDLGTGDCTIEAWIFTNSLSANQTVFSAFPASGTITGYAFNVTTSGYLIVDSFVSGTEQFIQSNNNPITANSWFHVAYTRSSGTNRLFVNGNLCTTSTNTLVQALNTGGNSQKVGYQGYAGFLYPFNGYISNLRVVKGTAVYTGAFTPSTTPLTAITNTSLLTLQSNRFIDNSTNAFAITVNGTPKVQAFQPFSPAASYSAATYGGSGYFNGTTDYLTAASNAAFRLETNTTWTWETWVYPTALNAAMVLSGNTTNGSSNGHSIYLASGLLRIIQFGVSNFASSATAKLNQWNHLAIVCNSGTATFYLNGTSSGSISWGSGTAGGTLFVGSYFGADFFSGWISGTRYQLGVAQVPPAGGPTSPVTATANTSLLLGYTNAGIYDAAWQNNVTTVGDAQVSTTQAQWPTTSMKFDGTGDYLTWPAGNSAVFGTGDFTVEAWVYCSSNPHTNGMFIIDTRNAGQTTNWCFYFGSGNGLTWLYSSTVIATSTVYSTGTWYYIAYTRSSNTGRLYVNGTQVATGADSNNYNVAPTIAYIATRYNQVNYFDGYIQDLRITKGVARTITTPTAAFPTR